MEGRKIDWKGLLARSSASQRISGLVVSIGVQHFADGGLPDRVVTFVKSLAGPGESSDRVTDCEFVLLCPDAGARRLAEISRELWDFQLQSLGDFAMVFSWGGAEVKDEPMEEATALAAMRMRESRRVRTILMSREITAVSGRPAARLS